MGNIVSYSNMSKFHDIFPKTNLNKTDDITNLTDIFNSRELFINDKDLTNEYIKFIRPINEEEEKNYTIKLYENVEPKDFINVTRPSKQYSFEEYYQLCKDEKLISDEKFEASNEPLFSVIVITYNKENNIMKSIRSIQNQSFKNIEIIIVDD